MRNRVKFELVPLLVLVILIASSGLSYCSGTDIVQEADSNQVDSIVVHYLDWNLQTRIPLSSEDVKDFNNGQNARYVIRERETIDKFVASMSLVELELLAARESADFRMVLEFYKGENVTKEICLRWTRTIAIDGNIYRSDALYYLILEYIPRTAAPRDPDFYEKYKDK